VAERPVTIARTGNRPLSGRYQLGETMSATGGMRPGATRLTAANAFTRPQPERRSQPWW